MVRAAVGFFILAIFAMVLGANGVAGLSMEAARMLLFIFLVLAVFSGIMGLFRGKRQ